jgi:acyl carrier protein
MQPVPIGVPGELFIGGVQVARGYVAQPKLTAARFLNDPFTEGGRLYRTGDMARWRPDGIIEFLGRLDSQVKLRGYRIELEEIETVLGRHQSVQACAVALREDTPGDQRLVAYVVTANGGAPTDIAELRAHLRSALPAYMVPSAWVLLPALPLTGSGKLDRAALPEADLPRTDEEESSQLEQAVAQVWRDVLGTGDVGPHSDFFEHGGHSLSAIRIAGRLGAAFGIEVPLAIIFNAPTVREQAHWLEQQSAGRGNTSR